MRYISLIIILFACSFMAEGQTKIQLSIGDKTMTATLADTGAARQLKSKLAEGPITIEMDEYGGFEMVGALPWSLTTSNRQIITVPGDIMLYQGYKMVIFYGSNSWSYTPLGKIDGATSSNVKEFVGSGNIRLTISLVTSSGIGSITADDKNYDEIYDLKGNRVNGKNLSPGIYIRRGKKFIVR